MKIWLPRTLQARIVLLFLVILMAGQFAAFRLFEYFEREPRAEAAALRIASTVNLTRAALLAASEERRLPLLTDLNRREGIRIYPMEVLEEIEPLTGQPLLLSIVAKVKLQLGMDTLVTVNHLGIPGLWVSFSIGDDDYWLVLPRSQIGQGFPWQWLGWGALIMLLSLWGAWLIMRRINRPLRQLARAADAIGRGGIGERLPESGAEEFTRVIHAFNTMSEALARAEADRNLLLGGVSHDLRTPLARLRLAVEMLPQEEPLRGGMVQDIDDMDVIVGQFLDLIRGTAGEELQPVSLAVLAGELAERYRRAGKEIVLGVDEVPVMPLRYFAMQRLLSNLLDNAFRHGGVPVELRVGLQEGKAVLSVLDHGKGLPEGEAERLMRPFERLEKARSDAGGAGHGLAIASRIAALHEGALRLVNRPQGGLEARVELPLRT